MKEDIDPFDGLDIQDGEFRDDDFREEELDFPYEEVDNALDEFDDVESNLKQELVDVVVDDDPLCPFCNFSFKGLSENVPSTFAPC